MTAITFEANLRDGDGLVFLNFRGTETECREFIASALAQRWQESGEVTYLRRMSEVFEPFTNHDGTVFSAYVDEGYWTIKFTAPTTMAEANEALARMHDMAEGFDDPTMMDQALVDWRAMYQQTDGIDPYSEEMADLLEAVDEMIASPNFALVSRLAAARGALYDSTHTPEGDPR